MRTSKIKSIDQVNEWGQGTDRHTYFHNLTMDNGDKINLGFKSQVQIGLELTYEITGEGQEWNKAKRVKPEFKKNFQKSSNGSFALSYAKDIICTFGFPSECNELNEQIDFVTAMATGFKKWLDENE